MIQMKRKIWLMVCVLTALLIVLPGCGGGGKPTKSGPFKVAFVYIGPPATWDGLRARPGRKALEEKFGDKIQTTFIENVPEGPDAARVIRQYAQEGYDMIFATSFGIWTRWWKWRRNSPMSNLSTAPATRRRTNGDVLGKIEQPRYLSGIVAGKMTESNIIGYVAAFPIPEVIRGINAFTLGVRSVNPAAEVRVVVDFDLVRPGQEARGGGGPAAMRARTSSRSTRTPPSRRSRPGTRRIEHRLRLRHARLCGRHGAHQPGVDWGTYYIETVQTRWMASGDAPVLGGDERECGEVGRPQPPVPQDVVDQVNAIPERWWPVNGKRVLRAAEGSERRGESRVGRVHERRRSAQHELVC
jgi:hypothetical protein